jgi:hypothetical protein
MLASNIHQGELEHRLSKRRYPRTPKKKDQMTRSMTSQDAIERLVKKVITAHETIVAQKANPRPKCLRTSPTDHYYIAKYSRESIDLTAWLVDLADDPAVKVRLSAYMFRSNFIAFFRTLSRASKTIYLPASVGLTLLGPSFVRKEEELDTDWRYYYVNMYVLFSPLLYYSLLYLQVR